MRRTLDRLLLTVCLVAAPLAASADGSFSALTYNVAGLPQGLSGSNPVANMPQISPLLNGFDLALVQEDFFYHEELTADLEHPFQSIKDDSASPDGQIPLGDGLNRFSRIPFTDHTRVTWDACFGLFTNASDCLAPKGFSVARHELEPGAFVDVYNWHAEAGGAAEDNEARRIGIRQMIDFMQMHSAGQALLVLGDTNSRYTDAEDIIPELLSDVGLTDVWVELLRGGVAPGVGPRLESCDGQDGFESGDCEIIDKILYRSSNRLNLVPSDYEVEDELFMDANGQPLSDHEAISTRFSYQVVPEPHALALTALALAGMALRRRR